VKWHKQCSWELKVGNYVETVNYLQIGEQENEV